MLFPTWTPYGIGVAVIVVVIWVARISIENGIKATIQDSFNSKLESLKSYNSRLVHDYSLYNTQRHNSYARVYELLLHACGHLNKIAQTEDERYNFEEYGPETISKMLEEINVPEKSIREICDGWDKDRSWSLNELYKWRDVTDESKMEAAVDEFHNEFLACELYLSETVAELFATVDSHILESRLHATSMRESFRMPQGPGVYKIRSRHISALHTSLNNLSRLRIELKSLLKVEMQQGYEGMPQNN